MSKAINFYVFCIGFLGTMLLGIAGWTAEGYTLVEAAYRSLLAFGGDTIYAPASTAAPLSTQLGFARFLGALTTISALVGIVAAFAGEWLKRQRSKWQRGHCVVVGSDLFARAEAMSLSRSGNTTIMDSTNALAVIGRLNSTQITVPMVNGDIETLIRHLGRPAHIVFATDRGEYNIELARRLVARRPDLKNRLTLRLENSAVVRELALYAPELDGAKAISASERIAEALCDEVPVCHIAQLRGQSAPHVLFFGMGQTGSTVLKEMAMRAHHPALGPLEVDVIDCAASMAREKLASDAPRLLELMESEGRIRFHNKDGLCCAEETVCAFLEEIEAKQELTCIVVALGEDSRNIGVAMRLREIQTTRLTMRAPILVRNRQKAGIAPERLNDLSGSILRFGGLATVQSDRNRRRVREALARRLHEGWQSLARKEGRDTKAWDDLNAMSRYTNMRAVTSAPDILRAAGFVGDPAIDYVPLRMPRTAAGIATETPQLKTALAECEHERWQIERRLAGYRRAPSGLRDDEMRLHPDLRHFVQLDSKAKAKDTRVLSEIIDFAAAQGRQKFVRPNSAQWRRRLRVAVFGPIFANADLMAQSETACRALFRALPLPDEAYALEILTPNAPGFDRDMATHLAKAWTRRTKRAPRIIAMQALRSEGLSRKALGLGPLDGLGEADRTAWDIFESQAMALAATTHEFLHIDMRPLGVSDAALLRDAEQCAALFSDQNRAMLGLADLCLFGANSEESAGVFTQETRAIAQSLGLPWISVSPNGATVSSDWANLAALPALHQNS